MSNRNMTTFNYYEDYNILLKKKIIVEEMNFIVLIYAISEKRKKKQCKYMSLMTKKNHFEKVLRYFNLNFENLNE